MALSKVDEVGQMRRRRGTSTKRMMKEETLREGGARGVSCEFPTNQRGRSGEMHMVGLRERKRGVSDVQAQHGEDDDEDVEGEDVGDAEGEAE